MLTIPFPQRMSSCRSWTFPRSPTDLLHASYLHGFEELGALIATLPREQVAEAARKQLRRLAVETGLNTGPGRRTPHHARRPPSRSHPARPGIVLP